MRMLKLSLVALSLALAGAPAIADEGPAYGPELEGFDYPLPVQRFVFQS